jgi:hypothetical protein
MSPVSTILSQKNKRRLRNKDNLLVLFQLSHDEHFSFYPASSIRPSTSYGSDSFAIKGGAQGGYYLRSSDPESTPSCPTFTFQKKDQVVTFNVYANDTCFVYSDGHRYGGSIVFPKKTLKKGVLETLQFLSDQSPLKITKNLDPSELEQIIDLITKDLRTGKQTKISRQQGQELDSMYRM